LASAFITSFFNALSNHPYRQDGERFGLRIVRSILYTWSWMLKVANNPVIAEILASVVFPCTFQQVVIRNSRVGLDIFNSFFSASFLFLGIPYFLIVPFHQGHFCIQPFSFQPAHIENPRFGNDFIVKFINPLHHFILISQVLFLCFFYLFTCERLALHGQAPFHSRVLRQNKAYLSGQHR